jgi:hypothetical protein
MNGIPHREWETDLFGGTAPLSVRSVRLRLTTEPAMLFGAMCGRETGKNPRPSGQDNSSRLVVYLRFLRGVAE